MDCDRPQPSQQPSSITPRWGAGLGAAATLVVLLLVWWQAGRWDETRLLSERRAHVEHRLAPYGNALTTAISRRFALLDGLAAFAQANPAGAQLDDSFGAFAAGLYAGAKGIRAIRVYPPEGPVLLYPTVGNEATVGRTLDDLINDERPNVRADVQRALQTRQVALSLPYELRQGGLARLAVYQGDTLWGLVVVVLDIPSMLSDAGLDSLPDDLELVVRDVTGQVFVGSEATFAADPVVYPVELPEGNWELAALPVGGWTAVARGPLRVFRGVGLVAVGLATSLVYLVINRQARLTRAMHERTVALAESQARYQQLFDSNSDALFLLDDQGHILDVNRVVCECYGFDRHELLDMTVMDLAAPELRGQATDHVRQALADGVQFEWRHRRKDGSEIPVEVSARPLTLNDQPRILSSARDITERVRAHEALQREHSLLQRITETSPVGIAVTDREGRIIIANSSAEWVLGLTRDQITRRTYNAPEWRITDEQGGPLADEHLPFRHVVRTGRPVFDVRHAIEWPDGRRVLLSINAAPLLDELGQVDGMVSALVDITERVQAEEALRALSSRQEAILDAVPEIIVEVDENRVYTWANPAGLGFFGEDMIGHEAAFYFEGEQDTYRAVQPLFDGDENVIYVESWQRRRDGQKRLLAWWCRVLKDESGRVVGALSSARDITEHKQDEETLLRYNERLSVLRQIDRDIVAARSSEATAGVVLKHIRQLIPCQQASVTLFDKDATEAVVYALDTDQGTAIGGGRRVPLVRNQRVEQLQSGQNVLVSDLWLSPEPLSPTARGLIEEGMRSSFGVPLIVQGQLIGTLNLAADTPGFFTAEHQEIADEVAIQQNRLTGQIGRHAAELEERVRERTAQLEAANKEMETFAYSVSHDLKAPLRGINGYSRLLLEDYADKLDEEGRTFLHTVRQAAMQMNQLIDDLLSYSRLERRPLQVGQTDLQELLQSLLAEHADEVQARSIALSVDLPCVVVSADRDGLAMAFRNLLDNAKFTGHTSQPAIEIGGRETETSCILWVRDNGAGFDMRFHDRILDLSTPASRGRVPRHGRWPGAGAQGDGAHARACLGRERAGTRRDILPGDTEMTVNKPILLVEDNPMDVDLTKRAFQRRKVTNPIEVARDGEEALEYIARWEAGAVPPAVILLDLKLPKVEGLEVLRRLKAHPVFGAIPVVVLTSSAEDRDVQKAYQLGANSYIVKPVDFEKFVEVAVQIELYWSVLNKPPV